MKMEKLSEDVRSLLKFKIVKSWFTKRKRKDEKW